MTKTKKIANNKLINNQKYRASYEEFLYQTFDTLTQPNFPNGQFVNEVQTALVVPN